MNFQTQTNKNNLLFSSSELKYFKIKKRPIFGITVRKLTIE